MLAAPRRMPNATVSPTWRGRDRRRSGNRCPYDLTTLTASSAAWERVSWQSSKSFRRRHNSSASRREAVASFSKPKKRRVKDATTTSEIKTNGSPRYRERTCYPSVGVHGPSHGRNCLLF
jgi:hypothetical protein